MAKEEILEKSSDLSWLYNVPMKVSVELGQGRLTIRDLLLLGQGTVLELDKLAGEPLEVLVNDRLVSRGEVVMVNDKYGIRLTDVISPDDKQDEN
ncbi:MAG: flagellar motor switch protein FliN [Bdellovibrionales bacterium GWA2_49_15]|nr:MAG: flagellar motor switch protein FliN [Bdellovibrionales bacterium GWA2_49_15]HAZ11991.1 flagellar motor switch protein FliN [Bdellovibrionales bacterium]